MVKEILKIRIDNGLGDGNPTFKDIEFDDYSAKFPRMGFPELTATLMWPSPLDDEWTHNEYVVLRGEKFYVTDTPDAEKTNDKIPYKHDLGFTSEFARILGNTYFEDAVPSYSETYDKPCSNSSKFTFYGTISELCDRLNCSFIKAGIADSVLKTKTSLTTSDIPVGDGYCVMLDPYGEGNVYDPNKSYEFSWEDKSHWEAITEGFNITEIPFERRGKCVIFGAIPKVVDHKFEYGHDNELLSIKHKNAKAKVVNRITMQGSSENIPYYYPNETEYGHISIAPKTGNKVLSADNIQIANMTQLLSRLNADSFAVFGKYDGVDVGDAKVEIESFSTCFGDSNDYRAYTLKTYKEHISTEPDRNTTIPWHINVLLKVTKAGVVVCRSIQGHIWKVNETKPTDDLEFIDNIKLERLYTPENKPQGITSVDYSQQMKRDGSVISLGRLPIGEYFFQFSISVIKRGGGRNEPIHAKCYLSSVTIDGADKQKTGYYWAVGDKKYDGVGALGVKINATITDAMIGDGFGWTASGRMPFQDHLIPPKYRNTLGAERFYNALNTPYSEAYALAHPDAYIDPDTGDDYVFPNPYIEGAPSEYIHKNEDIKPTIEGVTNASGQLLGEIADIAYDADDNDALKADSTEDKDKNDSLKYEHSFFYIKLNIFNGDYGFDLFSHASQTDAMTIQMREGSCNGCKFKIQAAKFTDETGLESYKNPIIVRDGKAVGVVSEEGIKESDLDPTQQNTQTHSIWICVQKDAQTFGRIYPNKGENIKPKIGDKFNIINIDLPLPYWYAAEKRLEEEGMRYMLDNNEEKFTFDISASRIFFAENPDVLAQLDEYSVIKVKYNGREYEQYVNQLSIDCKSNEPLPNIGIDLTDTLSAGQSFVEQVAERASSLIANPYTMGGATGGSGGGLTTRLADMRYLKKTEADRSKGKVASDVGFEVGEFVSGGSGGIFYQDPETGQTYIEADKLKVRMKAIFEELEIAKVSTIGGKFIITPGGGINISFVEELTDSYRCYFKAKEDDKGAECRFVVGDQVQCHEFNVQAGTQQNASNRYYWRLVTAVNNDESYIELSKSDCDNNYDMPSDAPQIGDTIVQLGHRTNTHPERQSAIILSTVDAFAPCVTLYNGIDNYSLDGKAVVEYGVDKSKNPPEPFFNCYGRFFFGPKGGNSYLKFEPSVGKLIFSGELINITSLNGKDIDKYITDLIPEPDLSEYDYLKEAIKDGATTTRGGLILSSLIKLGKWDLSNPENPTVNKIWSGINGIRNHDKTIATWWGGDMVDKYYQDKRVSNIVTFEPRPNPLVDGYAAALIRMDGTGYLSKGNIAWDLDGSGWLANKNIVWDGAGNITFGSGIKINLGDGSDTTLQGLSDSIASLTQALLNINNNFVPVVKKVTGSTVTLVDTTWDKITTTNPLYAVKSVKGFYSEGFISARGVNPDNGSGSGSAFGLMKKWSEYSDAIKDTDAISAGLGKELKDLIDNLPTTSVNPYALTIQKNGTTLGTYDGSVAKTINISDVASASALSSHTGNTTIHITAAERTKWNNTATNLSAILGSDTDNVINKYEEIVAFLDTYTEADTLANLLSNKADKATTLIGYGITDAYTKTEADGKYVDLTSEQSVRGVKTFPNGFKLATSSGSSWSNSFRAIPFSQNDDMSIIRYYNTDDTLGFAFNPGTGVLRTGRLLLTHNTAAAHIAFSRNSWNYITAPESGSIAFVVNGKATGNASTELVISNGEIKSGAQNNAVLLGNTSSRWKNIYSVLGNFSGQVTAQSVKIGDCEISWDATNGGLKFTKGIYSDSFVSARGVNSNGGGGTASNRLNNWADYTTDKSGYVLSAGLGYDLYENKADVSALSDYVTKSTSQIIDALKTFSSNLRLNAAIFFKNKDTTDGIYLTPMASGTLYLQAHTNYGYKNDVGYFTRDGSAVFQKFIKFGGTSSQFLKADGSVDSTAYLASSSYTASNVLAKLLTVDGSGSSLDADLLDGLHASAFARGGIAGYTGGDGASSTSRSAGWIRIAKITSYMGYGIVSISHSSYDSYSTGVTISVNMGYGLARCVISQLNGKSTIFTKARLVYPSNHSGNIYLEVYYNTTSGRNSIAVRLANAANMSLLEEFTEGSEPDGYVTKELVLVDGIGNASSATKLSDDTSFTAWGRTFFTNGKPLSISGNLDNVGTIYMKSGSYIYAPDSTGTQKTLIDFYSDRRPSFAYGFATAGVNVEYCGYNLYLKYGTSHTTGLILTNEGLIGVGTTTPTKKFEVNGEIKSTAANAFRAVYGSYGFIIHNNGSHTYFRVTDSGDQDGEGNGLNPMSINNSSGYVTITQGLAIGGNSGSCILTYDAANTGLKFNKGIYSTAYVSARGVSTSSDAELKNIIKPFVLSVHDIARAPSVEFEWKNDGTRDLGSIAQYFHDIAPLLTPRGEGGKLSLQYGKTALLGLINVARKVESHDDEIKNLRGEIKVLRKRIAQLERK